MVGRAAESSFYKFIRKKNIVFTDVVNQIFGSNPLSVSQFSAAHGFVTIESTPSEAAKLRQHRPGVQVVHNSSLQFRIPRGHELLRRWKVVVVE